MSVHSRINVPPVEVDLSWRELAVAGHHSVLRAIMNMDKDRKAKWGQDISKLTIAEDWMGTIGELAVAKHLNLYWTGVEHGRVDVGGVVDVRAVSEPHHRMPLHPDDRDDLPHVLALVERPRLPCVTLVGWIMGRDGKRPEFWQDPGGYNRPAFFVPNGSLLPMAELPILTFG